jgi:L-arabinose isomerase
LEIENMKTSSSPKIGLFGIGLDTYWPQFEGLKAKLEGYQAQIHTQLESFGAEVVSVGLVDRPDQSRAVGDRLRAENVDIVFLYVSTHALSSTVLPVAQRAGVPVVVPQPAASRATGLRALQRPR